VDRPVAGVSCSFLQALPMPDTATPSVAQRAPDLFAQVYDRLKAMASRQLRGAQDTLCTTAMVHELYLRFGGKDLSFAEQAEFFAYAARAMRHLLLDRARNRLRLHAGGAWHRTELSGNDVRLALASAEEALALETAIVKLERVSPRAAKVVELRYFAGLSIEQSAVTLGIGHRTADREWQFARAFLHAELQG
jgi:RNA polymerase sigma factor (TIGR02999 family)